HELEPDDSGTRIDVYGPGIGNQDGGDHCRTTRWTRSRRRVLVPSSSAIAPERYAARGHGPRSDQVSTVRDGRRRRGLRVKPPPGCRRPARGLLVLEREDELVPLREFLRDRLVNSFLEHNAGVRNLGAEMAVVTAEQVRM